jgi:extradiol dioxygenase family protein
MSVQLNHLIMPSKDRVASAEFISGVLGLKPPSALAHFMCGHFAFLVTEDEFDEIFARVTEWGITFWADPMHAREGEINDSPGRGFYFLDPDGNNMEVLTKPFTP